MMNKQQNTASAPQQTAAIDFSAIVARYRRYWWLWLASFIVCLLLAGAYLYVKKPVYLVVSTVLVDQDDNSSSAGASLLKSMKLGGGGSKVDDEVVVMGSQELCCQMIEQLGLNRTYTTRKSMFKRIDHYKDSPIDIDAPKEVFDTLSISMKFTVNVKKNGHADIKVKEGYFTTLADVKNVQLPYNVKTPYGIFAVSGTDHLVSGKEYDIRAMVSGYIPATEQMMKKMTVNVLSKKSNAIYMDVVDTDRQRGRDMLNTLITLYNERGQREKDEQAVNTGKFIDERLGLIYRDLTGSEAEIEAYKRAHNMVDAGLQTKSLIGKQEMAERALINLETQYRIVSMIKDFVSNPANRRSYIPFGADSTAAAAPVRAFNSLVMERINLSASATDNNQAMQRLDEQIDLMRGNVLKGVNNTLASLKIQIAQATAQSAASGGEMGNIPTEERETRALYRQQGIQNTLYTFLLQKREENALVLAATTPKGKIVDHAYAQTKPVAPKPMLVLLVTVFIAMLLPLLLIYIKNLFWTKFSTQDELEQIAQIPVIGHIHHNRHNTELVVQDGKTSSIVELFRYIRNNVQFMLTGENDKVVLVSSSISGEGKSFVSANLAAAFALMDKRVALVGLDIRKPRLAQMLNLDNNRGVTTFLSQPGTTLQSVVQGIEGNDNLDVIAGGPIPPNPSELLLNTRMGTLMEELRANYDIIIIDSAPVAMVSDTFSLTGYADAMLFVTRANFTKRNQVKYINRLAAEGRIGNAGMVINDTKPSDDNGYGYGYGSNDKD
ncbi:MAG: polysaccharide biosynthesis tyrosine autokinase [Bacteroidales bacterium]|nr:polysaccharide biosynthesis tyrosine autokinase [Candidatus Sodaliphilus aphodohippi]